VTAAEQIISKEQLFKGIVQIGHDIPLSDFNILASAFRITKSHFVER
jgi:glycosyltransferase A (GT-A) superfamily protein (DUF2064 family)